ncbi:hypothetical protein JTB14_022289 [Gonioctena quinquepunctata]|nr:hypothetical protein JTB14_022289 [Gonioctena quinquepunctata]
MVLAFGDASQEGYGAVVHLRSTTSIGDVRVNLICAKSKVSPFNLVSIIWLELCAAVLVSTLVKHVIIAYRNRVVISKIHAFSDSTTVIQWLNSRESKGIFVANRMHHIWEQLPTALWRHVAGETNPADCLSRGLTPIQLLNHPCWLSGPSWLQLAEENWPVTDWKRGEGSPPPAEAVSIVGEDEDIIPLYGLGMKSSSWMLSLRTIVHKFLFSKILQIYKNISAADLWEAEIVLIETIQRKHFQQSSSKLRGLNLVLTQLISLSFRF